ncbi:MAG: fimbrillin family protein [Alistipes sp.]|nr:fimbrillin family protein [Alistipes sp.]
MKRVNFRLFALAIALVATSCVKDVVVDSNFHGTPSEKICFGAELKDTGDETRGGVVSNRVGKHDLKSADGEFVLPMGVYVEDGICCAAAAETRGALFTNAGAISEFTVWAKHKVDNNVSAYFNGVVFEKNTTNNVFYSNDEYMWPGDGELTFVAITNAPESGFEPNYTAGSDGEDMLESFTYTVPADATAQNDIVLAKATYSGSTDASAPLTFSHIMSAVQFKVGTKMAQGKIKSITLNNIYKTGTYDIATGVWTPQVDSKGSYSVTFSNAQSDGSFEPNVGAGTVINDGTATFMLLPQQLADDVQLVVTFIYDNATDKEVILSTYISKNSGAGEGTSNYIWEKGKTTCYAISVDENYNLDVYQTKGEVLDAHYVMTDVTVNIETETDQPWTLTVEATNIDVDESGDVSIQFTDNLTSLIKEDGYWIHQDNNNNVLRGNKTLKGTTKGVKNVKLFLPENISAEDRKITLTLSLDSDPDNAKKEFVLYQKYPYWDEEKRFGWEKIENSETGTFGFTWDRIVCYTYRYGLSTGSLGGWAQHDGDYDNFNSIVDALITKYNASGYVTKKYYYYSSNGITTDVRGCVIIDYTKIPQKDYFTFFDEGDGLKNTKAFMSGTTILAFENALSSVMKSEDGKTGEHAFGMASGDELNISFGDWDIGGGFLGADVFRENRPYTDGNGVSHSNLFNQTTEYDMSGVLNYVIKRNRFDVKQISITGGFYYEVDMNPDNIKWYLPAKKQYLEPVLSFATGNPTFTPAKFWSSTADALNNANAFNGAGQSESRETLHQVVVQRIPKDGIIPTAPATVEIDNTSMQGGDNGEAQWVE